MKGILAFLICLCAAATAIAQPHISDKGYFEVDQVRGCAPFTVTLTDVNIITSIECTSARPCAMDFEGSGKPVQNVFGFTYNTPGTYILDVLYGSIDHDQIKITVDANVAPPYEVYTCTGNKVTLKVTDKTFETYRIDFDGNGTIDTTIPQGNNAIASFDYTAAGYAPGGSYPITVRGRNQNSADNCQNKTENYQTLDVLPAPTLTTLTAVDANNLKLSMTTAPHIQYKLEIGQNNSGTFQPFKDIYQSSTFDISNLLVNDNFYCFRLSAFDPCAGTNTYSNIVCSHDFDATFRNGVNELIWKSGTTGVSNVDIKRNQSQYVQLAGAPSGFNDVHPDYDCNKDYCYQLITNYAGGAKSISLEKCGVGILQTTFPPIDNVSSIVVNGVTLQWDADDDIDVKAFDIFRGSHGDAMVRLGESTEESFNDKTYTTDGQYCYKIIYSDFCENKSLESIVVCPVRLSGTIDEKNAITLTWSEYSGYTLGVAGYEIVKKNASGAIIETFSTTETTFTDFDPEDDQQIVSYEITALATETGIPASISNEVRFEKEVRLIFPTAFTPNGDAINPLFTISGKFVQKMSIKIFDRWGVLVYVSDTNEPWDGTRSGKIMPESAYVWKAEVVDFAGKTFTSQGTVMLLRPPR